MDPVNTFLARIYPTGSSRISLCLIPPDAQRAEHRFLTVEQLPRFLPYARYRNARGWNVYITPSLLRPQAWSRHKQSFLDRQFIIYLDCDQPHCLDRIRQRYPYPVLVVRTSKSRYQVYWRLHQPVSAAEQEQLMAAMALDVGADRAATDVSRVLRLPGFWNRKPGRNNTVDIVFTRHHAVSYQSLMEFAQPSPTADTPQPALPSTAKDAPPVLGETPQRSVMSESERDWYEVQRRLEAGDPPDKIVTWLQAKRSDKPNPRYYAHLTVSKAVNLRTRTRR